MAEQKQGPVSADSGITSKGLQTDVSPIMQPQGSYRFALNAINDSTDGAMGTLTNEEGNFNCANLQGYEIVGSVYMENDETALFVTNGGTSRIVVFNEDMCSTNVVVQANCLGFSKNHPIQAIYRKRKGCERVLYFTDDFNPIRAINIDSLQDYVVQGSAYTGANSNWDCSQFSLFRDMLIPHFRYDITNDGGGDVPAGSYSFACRYLDEDMNPTNFIAFSDPVPIYRDDLQLQTHSLFDVQGSPSGTKTRKSINWEITCDTRWDYVEVVVIPATGGDGNIDGEVYSIATLPIPDTGTMSLPLGGGNTNGAVVDFIFRGFDLPGVDKLDDGLDQITIDRNVYRTAKTLTQQANRLILGNVTENEIDHVAFTQAAMNIQSGYQVRTHPYEGGEGANDALNGGLASFRGGKHSRAGYFYATERTYMRDEVYAFGIVWVFNDGSETPAYHIPGRRKNMHPNGQQIGATIGNTFIGGRDINHPADGAYNGSLRTEHNRLRSQDGAPGTRNRFDGAEYLLSDVYSMVEHMGESMDPNRRYEKWELCNTAIRTSFTPVALNTSFDSTMFVIEGINSYWESKDFTYPDLVDCDGNSVFGSDAGLPIRHHKLPDTTLEPHFYGAQDKLVNYNSTAGNRANFDPGDTTASLATSNISADQFEDATDPDTGEVTASAAEIANNTIQNLLASLGLGGDTQPTRSMYSAPGNVDHVANIGFWFDNVQVPAAYASEIQGYRIVRIERTEADKSVLDKGISFYNHRTGTYSHGATGGDDEYCNWMAGDKYCWFYFQGNQYNKNKPMWQVDTCWGNLDGSSGCGSGSGCDANPYFVGAISDSARKPSSFVPTGCSTVGWPHTTDLFQGTMDEQPTGNAVQGTTCVHCNNASSSCMPIGLDFLGIQNHSERRANGYPMSMFFNGETIGEGTDAVTNFNSTTCGCGVFMTGHRGAQEGDGQSGGMDGQTWSGKAPGEFALGNSEIAGGCNCGGGLFLEEPVEDEDDGKNGVFSSIWNGIVTVVNFVVDAVVSAFNFVADIVANAFNALFGFDGVEFGDCCGSVSYWWGNRNNSISYHGPKVKFGDRNLYASHLKVERVLIGRPIRGKWNSQTAQAYLGESMNDRHFMLYSPEKLRGMGQRDGKSDGGCIADIMDYNVGSRVPWFRISEGLGRLDTGLNIESPPDSSQGTPSLCYRTGPNLDMPLVSRKIDAGFHVGVGERVEGVFEVPFDNCKGLETYVLKIGDTGCSQRHGLPFPGNNGYLGYERVPDDRTSCHRKDNCTPEDGDVSSGVSYAYWNREYCSTAYYISMKKYNPSQYGDLADAIYIKSSDGVYASGARCVDFNGDIQISKMAFRQASHMTKCAGRTTNNPSGNVSFLMTRSGVWYFTESEINTDLRHGDGTRDEHYFPYSYMGNDTEGGSNLWENFLDQEGYRNLYSVSAGVREKWIFTGTQHIGDDGYLASELPEMRGHVYNYNYDYSRITKEKKYFPVSAGTEYCSNCPQSYPHRVVYSQQSFQEEKVDTYKAFLSGAYKEIPGNTGSINNLFSYNNTLLCLTDESLWSLYTQNSQLQSASGAEELSILVSRGEFLGDDPRQILDSKTGYAGCDSQWSLQVTEFGPMWVDSRKGKVYHLAGTTPTEISLNGMKNFFNTNGPVASLVGVNENATEHDNPLLGYGYNTAYDPRYKRFIITKHDGDRSFTISYSLLNKNWTSFHGYFPNHYASGNKSFTGFRTYGSTKDGYKFGVHLQQEEAMLGAGTTTRNYQQFFNSYGGDFIIDLILNNNAMLTAVTNDIMWVTHAKVYDSTARQYVDVDDTFTNGVVYNSYQTSGKLTFQATNQSPTDVLMTAVNTTYPQARVNRYERTYKLNEFRDMVTDNTQPIWSSSTADINALYPWYIDKVVNPAAVGSVPWNSNARFRDKYLGIRLFFSNLDGSIKLTNNFLISTKTNSPR